jgi:hypothetical protein
VQKCDPVAFQPAASAAIAELVDWGVEVRFRGAVGWSWADFGVAAGGGTVNVRAWKK